MPEWKVETKARLAGLDVDPACEAGMVEEIALHLEDRFEELRAEGISEDEARRLTLDELSREGFLRGELRRVNGASFKEPAVLGKMRGNVMEETFADLRYALRMLLKNPVFTVVAVLTLALGIGANTAIFSVADRLMVRPLPVDKPERLAILGEQYDGQQSFDDFNYPLFRDYQRDNSVFEQLAATAEMAVGLGHDGSTERRRAALVSGNYFRMLGVEAALGRAFAQNEGVEIDDAPVVVLSHGLWEHQFNADPQVIGRRVTVNGRGFTVIGVAPREFAGTTRGQPSDLYLPITMRGQLSADRPGGEHPLRTRFFLWHQILGRLKDGVSLQQAQGGMRELAQRIRAVTPDNTDTNLVVLSGAQGFTQNTQGARMPLTLLFATAGLVLLIVCANLANLQLARASTRSREFAVRISLGARRARLVRGLLTESLVLSLGGAVLGLVVAFWVTHLLADFRVPVSFGGGPDASFALFGQIDGRVFCFALAVSVITGVGFGLAPAWRASRCDVVPELKGTVRGEAGAPRWNLRNALVVFQVALSLLVLVGAGLCVRSLQNLQRLDPGFEPSKVVLLSFDLGLNNYSNERTRQFTEQLLERVRALPGIEAASLATATPLDGNAGGMTIDRLEGSVQRPNNPAWADLNQISPGFFRTLTVPIVAGRDFAAVDAQVGVKTVIVNKTFAQRYWPGENVVGKHLYDGTGSKEEAWEIVGVVRDVASQRVQEPARPMIFRPLAQWPSKALTLSVRTASNPSIAIASLRGMIKSLDANVPVFKVYTLEQQKEGTLALQQMIALLLSGFGVLALLLAALGIFGVLAYSVSRRTREIGTRIALGAQRIDVLKLVVGQGMRLVLAGVVIGLIGAFGLTRLLTSMLFNVETTDPLTFVTVTFSLCVVAALACYIPARRATQVQPTVALRGE